MSGAGHSREQPEKRRRIALVIHSMTPGGAERATANMANHWAAGGHRVAVISLDSGAGEFYELDARIERIALDAAGASHGLPGALHANARRAWRLRRRLRAFAPDVVIGMMDTSALLCALATIGLGCMTIGAERTWPANGARSRLWGSARRHGYAALDAVVAQTEAAAGWLRANTRARRVVAIPNPLVWPIPSPPPTLAPASVLAEDRRLLLAVGRPEPVKGFAHLLAAFAGLARRHPDWDLVILGEGSQRAALTAGAQAHGLGERVKLPGQVGNVGQWYARADLFVLSSLTEGFPNVLIEAMSAGCPVVATRCEAGPAEIVREQVDGLLVAPGDPDALAGALEMLMADERLRRQFGERAGEARERFAQATVLGHWEALFDAPGAPGHEEEVPC